MRILILIAVSLFLGLIIIYHIVDSRTDVYGYGFFDFLKELFTSSLKEALMYIVICIIVGLVAFGILAYIAHACNFDEEDDEFDEERGLRLHTELIMDFTHGTENTNNTLYSSDFLGYRTV